MAPVTRVETPEGLYLPRSGLVCALPNGPVVQTSTDGIFEWDGATRRLLRITWFRDGLRAAAISIVGDVFFLVGDLLHVWRRATQTIEALIEVKLPLCFSADGTHVGEVKPEAVVVRRLADGATLALRPRPYTDGSVQLGHEGRWLLFAKEECPQSGSCTTDYTVTEVATGKAVEGGMLIGDDAQVGLSFDGRAVELDGRVTEVIPLDPALPRILPGLAPRVPSMADEGVPFTIAGGRALLWAGHQLIDLAADRPLLTDDTHVKATAISADGAFVAQLRWKQEAAVIPVAQPAALRSFKTPGFPDAIAVQTDGGVVLAGSSTLVRADGTQLPMPPKTWPIEVQVSRDRRVIALRTGFTSDPRGPVLVVADGTLVPGPPRETRARAARALALSPDGALLAVSTWDGIEVWETSPHRLLRTIDTGLALALAFSDDGRHLHALQRDLTVKVFPD